MALDVLSHVTVDDPAGLTDDAPHSADTALQYLLSRHGLGGPTSPELARHRRDPIRSDGFSDHRKSRLQNRNAAEHSPLGRETHHVTFHHRQRH